MYNRNSKRLQLPNIDIKKIPQTTIQKHQKNKNQNQNGILAEIMVNHKSQKPPGKSRHWGHQNHVGFPPITENRKAVGDIAEKRLNKPGNAGDGGEILHLRFVEMQNALEVKK